MAAAEPTNEQIVEEFQRRVNDFDEIIQRELERSAELLGFVARSQGRLRVARQRAEQPSETQKKRGNADAKLLVDALENTVTVQKRVYDQHLQNIEALGLVRARAEERVRQAQEAIDTEQVRTEARKQENKGAAAE